jgi:hypothetical protein
MLFRQFAYEGGLHAGGTNSASKISANQKSYAQVQPNSLKLSDIYTEFYEYFSPNNNKDLLTAASADKIPYYIEKNGKLYARVPDSSRSKLADRYTYDFAGNVKDMTDTEITISSGWKKDEHSIPEGDTFTLVYEDGVWKIGKFSYHY